MYRFRLDYICLNIGTVLSLLIYSLPIELYDIPMVTDSDKNHKYKLGEVSSLV